jgi:hypothetical protein
MALEPQAFGLPRDAVASKVNSVLGINSANAFSLTKTTYETQLSNVNNAHVAQLADLNSIIVTYCNNCWYGGSCPTDIATITSLATYNASPYAGCDSYMGSYGNGSSWMTNQYASRYNAYQATITAISNTLSSSVSVGSTRPKISGITNVMWDMITVNSTIVQYPLEASQLPDKQSKIMLIMRNSSTDLLTTTNAMAGLTPTNAKKFDDGMPYTGNVIAGKNSAQMNTTTGCTNVALATPANVTSNLGAQYLTSNVLANGCNVSVEIKTNL